MVPRTWRWLAAVGMVVVVCLIVLRLNFGDALVYFYTPDEVLAKRALLQDKLIRIGGLVAPASVVWQAEKKELSFTVTDGREAKLEVVYHGQKPDLFRENQGVVIEGRLDLNSSVVRAEHLMIKHSEKYSGKKHDGGPVDKKMLQESLIEQ